LALSFLNKITYLIIAIVGVCLAQGSDIPVYPFFRVVEGVSLPFVDGIQQETSPHWDLSAGLSYEYLTLGISVRSHFLASEADTPLINYGQFATEGHTVSLVANVEGKADLRKMCFAPYANIGIVWFHELDIVNREWSKYRLPIIGLGLDFRFPLSGKLELCLGGNYMAALEGFEVNAKAYNSINAGIGLAYDGGILR